MRGQDDQFDREYPLKYFHHCSTHLPNFDYHNYREQKQYQQAYMY